MKKLLLVVMALSFIFMGTVNAEEKYVAGGFEASGHINTGFGFQYLGTGSTNGATAAQIAAGAFSAPSLARDGWFGVQAGDKNKDFGFLLDEVELDLTKTFGENIRVRTDLSFTDTAIGSPAAYNLVEQAYVTANIAAGNGVEFLVGRFAAPIGYEGIDRNDNNTITRSVLFNYNLRPRTLTGAKFYYAFSDALDLHFYVANNLADDVHAAYNTDAVLLPAFGTRIGYTWGDEGKENTVGLSVAMSPEVADGGKMGDMSLLGDLDWNIWIGESFSVGGEGLFRQNSATSGATDTTLFGGILDLNYLFSDVWDGTLKYSALRVNNGAGNADATVHAPLLVAKAFLHEISAAGGYQIADGAKFKAEYKLNWTKYSAASKNVSHAFLGQFEYAF